MSLKPLSIEDLKFREAWHPTIRFDVWSSIAVSILFRGATKHGLFSSFMTPTTDRARSNDQIRLPELPIWLTCEITSSVPRRGQTYVRITLQFAGVFVATLYQGYLTEGHLVAWPPGQSESMTEGPGVLRSITGTDPAAGAEISETVPTNARWRLREIRWALVTDATVATRRSAILIDDGATELFRILSNVTQAASLTHNYLWVPDYPSIGLLIGTTVQLMIPLDLMLFQGWRIRSSTGSLQAGDDYGAPQLLVEEWIEE